MNFGARLNEIPCSMQKEVNEIASWQTQLGVIEVDISSLHDVYLKGNFHLIMKRDALQVLNERYSDSVQNEIAIRSKIAVTKK